MKKQIIEQLNIMIKDFMEKEPIPGLAIGIVSKDEIIYAKGFGVKDVNTNEPITEQTLFHMASVSKTTGVYFENYMKDHLLDKLEMKESHFLKPLINEELLATPHVLSVEGEYGPKISEVFPYHRAHGPSSTLCSNVIEMCHYAISILNKGLYKGTAFLSDKLFLEMFEEQNITNWGESTSEIGLSWFLGKYRGHRLVSHSGLDTGFRSNLLVLPEKEIAIVIMTNSDYIGTQIVWKSVLDLLLGENIKYIPNSLARYLAKMIINYDLNAAIEDYRRIKKNKYERYIVIEDELNYVAYELFEKQKVNEAIGLLEIAIDIYPTSSNLYDSLGEMYLYKDDKELALSHFRKSIKLDPENEGALRNIERMVISTE